MAKIKILPNPPLRKEGIKEKDEIAAVAYYAPSQRQEGGDCRASGFVNTLRRDEPLAMT